MLLPACPPRDPAPGALYIDPRVPASEVVVLTCGSWTRAATHVWTGAGWARLAPGVVRAVPGADVASVVARGLPRAV